MVTNREEHLMRTFPLEDGTTYIQNLDKHMSKNNIEDMFAELVRLEYEITIANLNGHRASDNDQYAKDRERVNELRKLLNK